MQGELAENRRASEVDKNELVAAGVQRQLAVKKWEELTEKFHEADQQMGSLKNEVEEARKELQGLKVRRRVMTCVG